MIESNLLEPSPLNAASASLNLKLSAVVSVVPTSDFLSIASNFPMYSSGVTVSSSATVPTNYDEVLKRIGSIDEYKNGESYYFVRIKHFGDDMTPWNKDETTKPSTSSIYPVDNQAGNFQDFC